MGLGKVLMRGVSNTFRAAMPFDAFAEFILWGRSRMAVSANTGKGVRGAAAWGRRKAMYLAWGFGGLGPWFARALDA